MKQTILANGKNVDMKIVVRTGEALRELGRQLCIIFPERENLIEQIIFALMTREHVLISGIYGTGKSDLFSTLLRCMIDANAFRIGFSKFMSETALFGVPVKDEMAKGKIVYNSEYGILHAEFAELDEFFDANAPLLRTTLGILNEKIWKRGDQVTKAKLHTAIACTNGNIEEELAANARIGAVIDRFIFQNKVSYLNEAESRRRMYKKYLTGANPDVKIPYKDLEYISGIVVGANQITDDHFIEVYDNILQKYRDWAKSTHDEIISDRRACKLLQLIEANALLYGRYDVAFEDILAIRHGLCGGDDKKMEKFIAIAKPFIQEAEEATHQNIDKIVKDRLNDLKGKIPSINFNTATPGELATHASDLEGLKKEVKEIKPQLASNGDIQKDILSSIDTLQDKVFQAIKHPVVNKTQQTQTQTP